MTRKEIEILQKRYLPGMYLLLKEQDEFGEEHLNEDSVARVAFVDDAGNIRARTENGKHLCLSVTQDFFRPLTQKEGYELNCMKLREEFVRSVNENVIRHIDWNTLSQEYENRDLTYATEILKQMHQEYVKTYGISYAVRDMGFVTFPAVIQGQDGAIYPGLVDLDLQSSGEHYGSSLITPFGVVNHNDSMTEREKGIMKTVIPYKYWYTVIPYKYWYTVFFDGDIHVDNDHVPFEVEQMLETATETPEETIEIGGIT